MGQLGEHDDEEYSEFMEKVCFAMVKQSVKTVENCNESKVDIKENIKEIHMSVGQSLEDEVIELTKNMSRETIIKLFARVAMAHSVTIMEDNPQIKFKMVMLMMMK